MKLLLTSGGVTNPSIHSALVQLLGKPVDECHALCVPTAQWGHPMHGPASVRGFVASEPDYRYLSGLGWASLGVLELTAPHRLVLSPPADPCLELDVSDREGQTPETAPMSGRLPCSLLAS